MDQPQCLKGEIVELWWKKKKKEWNEDTLYLQSFSFIVFLFVQYLIKNPMAACAISTPIYHLQTMLAHASTN